MRRARITCPRVLFIFPERDKKRSPKKENGRKGCWNEIVRKGD
jgi:hypothetical protein